MSMTDPTILQLLEKADCRYTLVVETSKRARQLIDGVPPPPITTTSAFLFFVGCGSAFFSAPALKITLL